MKRSDPLVTLGLPVFNGSRYIREMIDSCLAQTMQDFELIISDNASTDDTEDICRSYAASDSRVRYYRHDKNRGAAFTYNDTFARRSGSRYFKWVAHDDRITPDFLASAVDVLERNPAVVLCYSDVLIIDEAGEELFVYSETARTDSDSAHLRFGDLINRRGAFSCASVFGLIRADVMATMEVCHGAYTSSDRNAIAELSLNGPFHRIERPLLVIRQHAGQSTQVYPDPRERIIWFDSSMSNVRTFPAWKNLLEYHRSVQRVKLSHKSRLGCYMAMAKLCAHRRKEFMRDLEPPPPKPAAVPVTDGSAK